MANTSGPWSAVSLTRPFRGFETAPKSENLIPLEEPVPVSQPGPATRSDFDVLQDRIRDEIAIHPADRTRILGTVAQSTLSYFNADGIAIALATEGTVRCVMSSGPAAPDIGTELNVETGISGISYRERTSQYCFDARTDPRVDGAACEALGIRSILISPIIVQGEIAGLIELFSARDYVFGPGDVRVLETVTAMLAAALTNNDLAEVDQVPGPQPALNESGRNVAPEFKPLGNMQSQPDDELIAKLRSNATTASKPTIVSGILRRGREPRTRRLLSFFVIAVAVLLAVFALVRLMKANMGRATASSTAMRPHMEYVTPAEGLIDVTPRKTSRTRNIPKTENLPYPPTVPKSTSSNLEAAGTRAEPTLPPSLATSSDGAKVLGDVIASASPSKAEAVVTPPSKPAVSEVVVGKLDKSAVPIYPQIAKIARVEGVVVLRASVDREGRVREVSVVSGHPMLTAAAADAVKRWRYKPYLLNGEPVEAETTIQINFTLPK